MKCFRVENGAFYRGNKVIFSEMTFEIDYREILAILGCNGVGKTTLIQCCMGFLKWKRGQSYLQNQPISLMSSKELFSKIAYIPQAKNLNIGLSVLDMVLLGCNTSIHFCPKKEHIEKAKLTLETLGIFHLHHQTCDCLSGGELQMVAFARALINNPSLVILDEPESNLDFKNQHKILNTLQQLKDNGKSIIINTHYPQNAQKLADKVLIMHKQKPHILGDKSLINRMQLGRSFEVEEEFFDYLAGV